MGKISDFVKVYDGNRPKYSKIEEEVRLLCEEALQEQKIEFLWQSRVKATKSLEKKLLGRIKNYRRESENIADIKDLVAGRIILARWLDIERVEKTVRQKFLLQDRAQLPKYGENLPDVKRRFRGYGGLHFHVTRREPLNQQTRGPIIEIQVMSGFMWSFMTLEHDIVYKQLHGEPNKDMVLTLELLKGVANLGEIALELYDRHHIVEGRLSPGSSDVNPDLPATIQAVMTKIELDEQDKRCLHDLRLTDPRLEKERIRASKDQLLEGSCSWILNDEAFIDWWTSNQSRSLWIHGDPGKGKTMMTISLIDEVSKRLGNKVGANVLAYFFCQNTNTDLNNAVAVLRGLIYSLVDQEKKLICHIRKSYDSAGKRLFEDETALYGLQKVLLDILKDPSLGDVYFMIDGLDECDSTIHALLVWIIGGEFKIKLLTTSRNEQAFMERLGHGHQLEISLEQNSAHVADAVAMFINHRVEELAKLKSYSYELQDFVRKSLYGKAGKTLLWVALVCKELKNILGPDVELFLDEIPTGLAAFYERMLNQVLHQNGKRNMERCRRILCSVALAFRPLRLKEIAVFAKLEIGFHNDASALKALMRLCGSFITIRDDTAYLVHQSAKEYLIAGERKGIFHLGQEHEHANTARHCLEVMSNTLRRDICDLKMPGVCLSDVDTSKIGDCIPFHAQYACLYWVAHVQRASPTEQENLEVLEFLRKHFLHWLEALSLTGKISEAVLAIKSFCATPKVKPAKGSCILHILISSLTSPR